MPEEMQPVSNLIEEFLTDEESEGLDNLTNDQKMDLLVYHVYNLGHKLSVLHGLLLLWTIAVIGISILYFFFGGD